MTATAFLFPGQGSQFAGMGRAISSDFPIARQTFEEADDALGFKISSFCFEGPDDELKLTANTQPAILTTSIAVLRVVQQETGLVPDFVAGHSLGEYTALVASGALTFVDAVQTVRSRGIFMQDAVPVGTGAMAAMLGIEAEELSHICREAAQGEVVSPANYNSPGQIVIAGNAGAVARAIEIAKGRGYRKTMLLPVSAPFHCSLMQPAADRLAAVLADLDVHPMAFPVISNVEATPNKDHQRVRELLVDQVCAPVLWEQSVELMAQRGVTRCIEIGPGKVLSGLVKRITKEMSLFSVEEPGGLTALESIA